MHTELIDVLVRALRQLGERIAPELYTGMHEALAAAGAAMPEVQLALAWQAAGLQGRPAPVMQAGAADLPLVAWQDNLGWLVVTAPLPAGAWQGEAADGRAITLRDLAGTLCFKLPSRQTLQAPAPLRAATLVWQAVMRRSGVFVEAAVATAVVNFLTLSSSIYSMQVYDRVIPNQGLDTLWVLTVGVGLAALLELLLKHVRGRSVDRANVAIDHELSQWFFGHLLRMRMDRRPASVGTLASQMKSLELIRGVLGSTSLFVLADIPFALFFVAVIGLIGGWVVIVPIVALPLALAAGLVFQRAIGRLSRQELAGSNLKTGLLVESIDGAESLKATGGDWKMQSRWNRLSAEVGEAELDIKNCSAMSQNLTVTLQQISYIALIATGAWLAADNKLSMGALLACSIISNRAMMPIIQLPGILVQWAHASAAIDGLNLILGVPTEDEDGSGGLSPQALQPEYRFERAQFSYGASDRAAIEIEALSIRPGERIGILGAVGSGKSTLLKLASGLYRPGAGKVFLGGIDMALISPVARREMAGYLPQDLRLFSGTLRDNLLLGMADPGDEAILAAARRTGLADLIGTQPRGLALPITEGGRGVSGGQRQLIAMTRLLLAAPRVWLLDEPTGSMDAVSEMRILQLLQEAASEGKTVLVATHKMALLPLFDRLIVLQGGRIAIDGPRNAVVARLSGQGQSAVASAPVHEAEA